jgi:choline dehydrogenase-like flavoprotein
MVSTGSRARRNARRRRRGWRQPFRSRRAWRRDRFTRYGENPWGRDHLEGYEIEGPLQSRSMQVGGLAMHWGAVTPRFSPEDFKQRTLYGVGTDWPIDYDELDPFYQEAEEVMGVAGEQGPHDLDPRQKPFPQPPIPLTYNLELLKAWAAKAGIPMWSQPWAKNSIAIAGGRSVVARHLLADLPDRRCTPALPEYAARDEAIELMPRTLVEARARGRR